MRASQEFISEPIEPHSGSFDARTMARGLAGLPTGFTWRGRDFDISRVLDEWKRSEVEGHRGGERYYRRHYFRVEVGTGEIMTLYAVRRVKRRENPKSRWWLYSIERD